MVLHDDQSIKLCLNPHSPRYGSFKPTQFSNLFRDSLEIVDPVEIEAANECFIADCRMSARRDTQGIVQYLQSKCGLDKVTIFCPIFFNCPLN